MCLGRRRPPIGGDRSGPRDANLSGRPRPGASHGGERSRCLRHCAARQRRGDWLESGESRDIYGRPVREHRGAGFVECAEFGSECERVLAVQLRPLVGGPIAIGLGLESSRLPAERGASFCSCWLAWPKRSKATAWLPRSTRAPSSAPSPRRRLTRSGANGSIRCVIRYRPRPASNWPRNTKSRI